MANRHLSRSIAVQSLFPLFFLAVLQKKQRTRQRKKNWKPYWNARLKNLVRDWTTEALPKNLLLELLPIKKRSTILSKKRRRNGRYRRSRPLTAMSCALAYMSCYMGREKRFLRK